MHSTSNSHELFKVQTINNIPVVDAFQIAEHLGIEKRAMRSTITSHLSDIENHFGRVTFQMQPFKTTGGTQTFKVYYLTEEQAYFVATLSRNTVQSIKVKALLVKSFMAFRQVVAQPQLDTTPRQLSLWDMPDPNIERAQQLCIDVALQAKAGSKMAQFIRLVKPLLFAAKGGMHHG